MAATNGTGLFKIDALTGTRRLFYLITPNESTFQTLDEVPNYLLEAGPFVLVAIVLELIVGFVTGNWKVYRVNDSISSLGSGLCMMMSFMAISMFVHSIEFIAYILVYENLRLTDIAWNSPWGWLLCFIGVDLGYYWFHRVAHEVNFMWAAHQVHHSSEDYNLGTAIRQSIFQRHTAWIFYLPMALFVSPPTAYVHIQFVTLYQFWIHTEFVGSLGPVEYILNTPSHHRVHHGRNPYCIDKNYGGTLIIWDRLFGTFAPERERVVYGLVHPIASWNPFYIQFCHLMHMWNLFWTLPGLGNKLSVIFKGPGWEPGKPRCGLIEDLPKVKYPEPKYDIQHSSWADAYVVLHYLIIFLLFDELEKECCVTTQCCILVYGIYNNITHKFRCYW